MLKVISPSHNHFHKKKKSTDDALNGRQHIDLAEEQLTWTRVVFVTSGDSINTLHHPGGLVRCFMAECI